LNAKQIKAARAALNWTQTDLAQRAGIHPKSVAYWEAPERDGTRSKVGAIPAIRDAFKDAGIEIEGGRVWI
jgi:transcriptional regulator with XRE-family HTH domain